MREIERSTQFERDYEREARGRHRATLEASLAAVFVPLMSDEALAERFRDHPLSGEWAGFRDCHVQPDLVLICGFRSDRAHPSDLMPHTIPR